MDRGLLKSWLMREILDINLSEKGGSSKEVPVPEDQFRKIGVASRPTFYRWEKQGLRVLRINGRRFIYRSDLIHFLETLDAARKNTEEGTISELAEDGKDASK